MSGTDYIIKTAIEWVLSLSSEEMRFPFWISVWVFAEAWMPRIWKAFPYDHNTTYNEMTISIWIIIILQSGFYLPESMICWTTISLPQRHLQCLHSCSILLISCTSTNPEYDGVSLLIFYQVKEKVESGLYIL